jgi:hypothetical protein
MRVTVTYDVVKAGTTRKGPCPACGKTTSRSRTFEETVNPLNLNEDGLPKSYPEVLKSVRDKSLAWDPDPDIFTHQKCREGADGEDQ